MNKYRIVQKKGEGTFSEVLKAQNIHTQQYVAIKILKQTYKSIQSIQSLNELTTLKQLCHANSSNSDKIVKLLDVVYDEKLGKLALVFELMDCNLYEYIEHRGNNTIHITKLKFIYYDILLAIQYIHSHHIFHRDIKPENILITKLSATQQLLYLNDTIQYKYHNFVIKIADFGSSHRIDSHHHNTTSSHSHHGPYTEYISTRWYRAPECLLTNGYYDWYMDIWGVGCVFYELLTNTPLFTGSNELDQIDKICRVLGDIPNHLTEKYYKSSSTCKNIQYCRKSTYGTGLGLYDTAPQNTDRAALELIESMLRYVPTERITVKNALKHSFFDDIRHCYSNGNMAQQSISTNHLLSLHTDDTINTTSSTATSVDSSHNNKLPHLNSTTNKTQHKRVPLADKSNQNTIHKKQFNIANQYKSQKSVLPILSHNSKKVKKLFSTDKHHTSC